jgi:peroxiredoxin
MRSVSIAGKLRFVVGSFRGGRMLKVGDEAPDFEVNDHRGRKVALHDLRGRKVVLWFYPKADTPG